MLAGYAKTKGTPAPELSVGLSGAMLVLGGASLLLGYHPTFGSGLLIIFLLIASFKIHNFWAVSDPAAKMMDMVNFTKNMGLIGMLLMLVYAPKPWPVSLDSMGL